MRTILVIASVIAVTFLVEGPVITWLWGGFGR